MGVLPGLRGILCHDHWGPYYRLDCIHSLCNAHHLRELTLAWEQDDQQWANEMKELLKKINTKVNDAGGELSANKRANTGTDKCCDCLAFVDKCRQMDIKPHVTQKQKGSAVDSRTIRHEGNSVSLRVRKRVEEVSAE